MTPLNAFIPTVDTPCTVHPEPDLWHGNVGEQQYATRLCQPCPVRQECLAYVLHVERVYAESGRWGVWGGLLPAQRAKLAGKASA